MSKILRELNKTKLEHSKAAVPTQTESAQPAPGPLLATLRAELDARQEDFLQRAKSIETREDTLRERISALEQRADKIVAQAKDQAQSRQADVEKRLHLTQAAASKSLKENAEFKIRIEQFEAHHAAVSKRDSNTVQQAQATIDALQAQLRQHGQEVESLLAALAEQDTLRATLVEQTQKTEQHFAARLAQARREILDAAQTHAEDQETGRRQADEIKSLSAQLKTLGLATEQLKATHQGAEIEHRRVRAEFERKLAEGTALQTRLEQELRRTKEAHEKDHHEQDAQIKKLQHKLQEINASLAKTQSDYERTTAKLREERSKSADLSEASKRLEQELRREISAMGEKTNALENATRTQEAALKQELEQTGDTLLEAIDAIIADLTRDEASSKTRAAPVQRVDVSRNPSLEHLSRKVQSVEDLSKTTQAALSDSIKKRNDILRSSREMEALLRTQLNEAGATLERLRKERDTIASDLDTERSKHAQSRKQMTQLEDSLRATANEKSAQREALQRELKDARQSRDAQQTHLRDQIAALEKARARSETERINAQARADQGTQSLKDLQDALALGAELEEARRLLEEAKQTRSAEKDADMQARSALEHKLRIAQSESSAANEIVGSLKDTVKSLETAQAEQRSDLTKRIKALEWEAAQSRESLGDAMNALTRLNELQATLQHELHLARQSAASAHSEREGFTTQIESLSATHAREQVELTKRLATLEQRLEEAAQSERSHRDRTAELELALDAQRTDIAQHLSGLNAAETLLQQQIKEAEFARARAEAELLKERKARESEQLARANPDKQVQALEQEVREAHSSQAETQAKLDSVQKRAQQQQEQFEKARRSLEAELTETRQAGQSSIDEITELRRSLNQLLSSQSEQQKHLKDSAQTLNTRIQAAASASDDSIKQIVKLEKALAAQREQQRVLEKQIRDAEQSRQTALAEAQALRTHLDAKLADERQTHQDSRKQNEEQVAALKKRIAELEKHAPQAAASSRTAPMKADAQHRQTQDRLAETERARTALEHELSTARAEHNTTRVAFQELSKQLSELLANHKDGSERDQKRLAQLDLGIQQARDARQQAEAQISAFQEKLETQLADERKALQELRTRNEERITDLEKKLAETTTQLGATKTGGEAEHAKTRKQLQETEQARAALEKDLSAARHEHKHAQGAFRKLSQQLNDLLASHKDGSTQNKKRAAELDKRIQQADDLRKKVVDEVASLRNALDKQRTRETQLQEALAKAEACIADTTRRQAEQDQTAKHAQKQPAEDPKQTPETLLQERAEARQAHDAFRASMEKGMHIAEREKVALNRVIRETQDQLKTARARENELLAEIDLIRKKSADKDDAGKLKADDVGDELKKTRLRVKALEARLLKDQTELASARERSEAQDRDAAARLETAIDAVNQLSALLDLETRNVAHILQQTDAEQNALRALLKHETEVANALHNCSHTYLQERDTALQRGALLAKESDHARATAGRIEAKLTLEIDRLSNELEQAEKHLADEQTRLNDVINKLRVQVDSYHDEAGQSTSLLESARLEIEKQRAEHAALADTTIPRDVHERELAQLKQQLSAAKEMAQSKPPERVPETTEPESDVVLQLEKRIQGLSAEIDLRDARLTSAQKALGVLRETNAQLRESEQALQAQLAQSAERAQTSDSQWLLRLEDDQTFGPVTTRALLDWAEDCRIGPEHLVSPDAKTWRPAKDVSELRMDWTVELIDGTPYGPFNLHALHQLVEDDVVSKASVLTHGLTGATFSVESLLNPELARVTEENERLTAETRKLETELRVAQARIKELEQRYGHPGRLPKQIKLPPKMVRAPRREGQDQP